ncbi:485_t:CDS:2 [Gigaspora margarita]|uniref:485_t:CDS:1 n=1 Tax=Gigaspora margarita TaxID=4874 RepID=A0ABN7V4H8_GIGMA|nr:485_t:CDS:2 [Gigaspora margarita]
MSPSVSFFLLVSPVTEFHVTKHIAIYLTTDLWTAKSGHRYLGVTATWLTSNFEFCKALLSCNHLPYPHSDEQHLPEVKRQSCVAHTLQLSVLQGLKQCNQVHCHVKCLQAFFHLPKQAQRLREAQKNSKQSLGDYDDYNPLDVMTDVKTRIIELHNSMLHVSTTLLTKPDRASQQEGEKLNRLCLSRDKKHLVHPYVELLKKAFAPKCENEEKDGNEEESDSSTSDDNKIPSGGSRRHWQYAHHAKKEINVDDFNQIKSLPAANTVGLLQKVQAAIFLSLDELWPAPSDLDDIFKEREKSLELLQELYDSMKEDSQPRDISAQQQTTFYDYSDDDDDFFKALENKVSGSLSVAEEKDEKIE